MQRLKRVLLSVMEVCVFLISSFLTVALTELLNSNFVFICGTGLTICILLAIRRKTRKWKINYAAENWLQQRAKSQLAPHQAGRARRLRHLLLWLPSFCAGMVLCFFPLASHFLYSGKLLDYRVPIPWAWTVVYRYQNPGLASTASALIASDGLGRFGVTPFWQKHVNYSVTSFAAYTWSLSPEDKRQMDFLRRQNATDISTSEFTVGELHFSCVEYLTYYARFPSLSGFSLQCESPTADGKGHFRADLFGRKEDVPAFDDVLRRLRRVN
jgi:hypothetical protein